jgi:hypothetical protein
MEEFTLLFMALSSLQLNGQKYTIIWKWSVDGKYFVASAYECQWWGALVLFSAMPVWKATTEPKCMFLHG